MKGGQFKLAWVIALSLCAAFHIGCFDDQPEQSSVVQDVEAATRSPIAQLTMAVATPQPEPSTSLLPTPLSTGIVPSPTPEASPDSTTSANPEPVSASPASAPQPAPAPHIVMPPIQDQFGQSLLKERINASDVIARVRLSSTEPVAIHRMFPSGSQGYAPAIKYTFETLEYLRGSGGDEIVAVAPDFFETTEGAALRVAARIFEERDSQWDSREAIVFLRSSDSLGDYSLRFVIMVYPYAYTIDNPYNKTWLPATTPPGATGASGQATGEMRFLLDSPVLGALGASGQSQIPTITLSELRSQVNREVEILKAGEAAHGKSAYRQCLAIKYRDERIAESGSLEYRRLDIGPVDSGLPTGTRIGAPDFWGHHPEHVPGQRIEGNDAYLFTFRPLLFHVLRPLPGGEYKFYWSFWGDPLRPICGADVQPEEIRKSNEVFVNVTAPEGTLHEAFFDPVLDTSSSAVGADGANGVLKPSAFAGSGGATTTATTTIRSLTWKSGVVNMNVSPHTAISGHILDFIEPDGTVSLSLRAADATADADNSTLSWTAPSQPWEDGDTLMLRIRKELNRAPEFDT